MTDHAPPKDWWRTLPLWLKGLTLLVATPAWVFIIYCVLSGRAKTVAAFLAFAVFVAVTLVHIIFDKRNPRGDWESNGIDFGGGE